MRPRSPGSLVALLLGVLAVLGLAACGSSAPTGDVTVSVDGRSFTVHRPTGFEQGRPITLVLGLHGYTSSAHELDSYLGLTAASDDRGFLLALPEGLKNPEGHRYWNADEGGCCDFFSAGTDDSGWLSHVVTTLRSTYDVDRVVVVGHSNGGFMAYRFACDHADQVDAIASLAGPLSDDPSRCKPSRPVTVLHIHGDADDTVAYDGAPHLASALATAQAWVGFDGCSPTPARGTPLDLDKGLPGAETSVRVWQDGCRDGTSVRLWTIAGGGHVPTLTPAFTTDVLDVVLGH